jgi:hypothetical protein
MRKGENMSNNTNLREQGQGLIEYIIILILVAACVIGGIWATPKVIAFFKKDEPPQPTQPTIQNEGNIEKLVETGSTVEIIDTEAFPTNNCNSSSATEIQTQRTRQVEHLVIIEGQGGIELGEVEIAQIPFLKLLKVNLEGKYGVQDKQIEERSYTIKFTTSPHTQAIHTTRWKYSWYAGEATIKLADGTTQVYTYRVRTSLEPETTSEEISCP